MNKDNVRIKYRYVYIPESDDEDGVLLKLYRPVVQIKILFFWITLKEFNWYNKHVAESQARKFYNCLTQQNYIL